MQILIFATHKAKNFSGITRTNHPIRSFQDLTRSPSLPLTGFGRIREKHSRLCRPGRRIHLGSLSPLPLTPLNFVYAGFQLSLHDMSCFFHETRELQTVHEPRKLFRSCQCFASHRKMPRRINDYKPQARNLDSAVE